MNFIYFYCSKISCLTHRIQVKNHCSRHHGGSHKGPLKPPKIVPQFAVITSQMANEKKSISVEKKRSNYE